MLRPFHVDEHMNPRLLDFTLLMATSSCSDLYIMSCSLGPGLITPKPASQHCGGRPPCSADLKVSCKTKDAWPFQVFV